MEREQEVLPGGGSLGVSGEEGENQQGTLLVQRLRGERQNFLRSAVTGVEGGSEAAALEAHRFWETV